MRHMVHDMLHVISALCAACELHIIVPWPLDRLVGLVVKASASRAEGPGFESR